MDSLAAYHRTQRQSKWKTREEGTEDMSVQVGEEAAKKWRTDVLLVIKIYWNDAAVYLWHHRGDNKHAGNTDKSCMKASMGWL